jgi:hypothetical protein
MQRTRRVAAIPALVILLAACAGPGTGAGGTGGATGSPGASPTMASPGASGATSSGRVDIGALAADPDSFEGQPLTVLARVDSVLIDGTAFLTSPSGSDEGQFAVIIKPGATVDKEPTEGAVVWVDGTLVGLTAEHLADAGVDVTPEQLSGFDGEWVLLADAIRDPLGSSG